jgi:hypothetical protein
MALELLAGPFELSHPDGDHLQFVTPHAYVDGLGLLASLSVYDGGVFQRGGMAVVMMDGQSFIRGSTFSYEMGYASPQQLYAQVGAVYKYNPALSTLGDNLMPMDDFTVPIKVPGEERWIRIAATTVETSTDGTTWTTEATLVTGGSGGPRVTLLPGARVAIGYTNGVVGIYDMATQALVPNTLKNLGYTTGCMGAWYSAKHDVWISLYEASFPSHYYTRIWSNTLLPTALSNPVALTTVTKGRVSVMRVRLTDAQGRGCPDELVGWTLTGDGALSATQSKTDEDGYATVKYIAPLTGLPTFDIDAEVLI